MSTQIYLPNQAYVVSLQIRAVALLVSEKELFVRVNQLCLPSYTASNWAENDHWRIMSQLFSREHAWKCAYAPDLHHFHRIGNR